MTAPEVRPMRQIVEAVAAWMLALDNPIPHVIGAQYLADASNAGARYVWVETIDNPGANGGGPYKGGGNPRSLFTFDEGVEIHCWGVASDADAAGDADVHKDVAYLMRNNLIQALRGVLKANYKIAPSGWLRPREGAVVNYGAVYVLSIAVQTPAPDVAKPTVAIAQIAATVEQAAPDGTTTPVQNITIT